MSREQKVVDTEIAARTHSYVAPVYVPLIVAGSGISRPTVNYAVMPGHSAASQAVNHAVMPGHPAYKADAATPAPRTAPEHKVIPMAGYRHGRGGMGTRPTGTA
jgi:hypothetical protein